jgi:hypothetical protein
MRSRLWIVYYEENINSRNNRVNNLHTIFEEYKCHGNETYKRRGEQRREMKLNIKHLGQASQIDDL